MHDDSRVITVRNNCT